MGSRIPKHRTKFASGLVPFPSSSHVSTANLLQRYPSLDQTATFSGHTHRVLYLAMSPDGRTIVTGAGDETLRFWAALPERKDSKREARIDDVVGRIR